MLKIVHYGEFLKITQLNFTILAFSTNYTVFENYRKSRVKNYERSELRLHFEWTKVDLKCQKLCILTGFRKHKAYGHTVLPDRPLLKRTKIGRNGRKCQNLKI